jgi:ATP-binding cassette subfamily A (ABC1) protein 3
MREQLNKFSLLLWKNWKLQYRRPLQTTVEIAAPIIFSILLVVVRSLVDPEKSSEHKFLPFHPAPLNFFSPKNTNSSNFLTDEGPTTLAGIQFDDDLYNKDYIPPDIEVSLR